MWFETFPVLLSATALLADSSSGDSNALYLLAIGPAAAVFFYTTVHLRYRNTDKRHEYERQTSSEISDVQGYDTRVQQFTGLRNRWMDGRNEHVPTQRLGHNTTIEREAE